MNGISNPTMGELGQQGDGDEALTDDALEGVSGGAEQTHCSYCGLYVKANCTSRAASNSCSNSNRYKHK